MLSLFFFLKLLKLNSSDICLIPNYVKYMLGSSIAYLIDLIHLIMKIESHQIYYNLNDKTILIGLALLDNIKINKLHEK
jgi:hypothetical protein